MALSEEEEARLRDILTHVHVTYKGDHTELRLKNVEMWTSIGGQAVVAVVDTTGTPGVQRPIGIRGASKCIICDEYDNKGLVCQNCQDVVKFLRTADGRKENLQILDLLRQLREEGLLETLSLMNRESIKTWMDEQIEGMK
jgi:hypothetical protein